MAAQSRITEEVGHLRVQVTGDLAADDARQIVAAILDASRQRSSHRILVDLREAVIRLSLLDLYEVGESSAKLSVGMLDKVALVSPPESLQPDRFFQRVSQNRGLNLRVFTDLDEAAQWLRAE